MHVLIYHIQTVYHLCFDVIAAASCCGFFLIALPVSDHFFCFIAFLLIIVR